VSVGLNVVMFKARTIIKDPPLPEVDVDVLESSLTKRTLPFFHIKGKKYVLLSHIQKFYNLRKDYSLAYVAKGCGVAKGFIDVQEEPNKEFLALDIETFNESFIETHNDFSLWVRRGVE